MDNFNQLVVYSIDLVNAKTTGPSLIATTENGSRKFYPTHVILEVTAASGISVPMTASVGTNPTAYNNIMAAGLQGGLLALGNLLQSDMSTVTSAVPPNTGIYVNIVAGATGASQTVTAHVVGFYR